MQIITRVRNYIIIRSDKHIILNDIFFKVFYTSQESEHIYLGYFDVD